MAATDLSWRLKRSGFMCDTILQVSTVWHKSSLSTSWFIVFRLPTFSFSTTIYSLGYVGALMWKLVTVLGMELWSRISQGANPRSTPPPCSSRRTKALSTPPQRQAPPNSPPPFHALDPQFTPTPPRRNAPQPSPRRKASPRHEESPRWNQRNKRNYDP